jgi:hypothetical protein
MVVEFGTRSDYCLGSFLCYNQFIPGTNQGMHGGVLLIKGSYVSGLFGLGIGL